MNKFLGFLSYVGPLFEKSADNSEGGAAAGDDDNKKGSQNDDVTDYKAAYLETKAQLEKANAEHTKSYTGLQKTLATRDASLKTAQEAVDALTLEKTELVKNHGTLNSKSQEAEEKLTKTGKENLELRLSNARFGLIISKFPHLASFEADHLIPTSEDAVAADGSIDVAKIETLFTSFSSKMGALADASKQEFKKGSLPGEPPQKEEPGSAAAFKRAAQTAALKGDVAEFNKNQSEYLRMTAPQAK